MDGGNLNCGQGAWNALVHLTNYKTTCDNEMHLAYTVDEADNSLQRMIIITSEMKHAMERFGEISVMRRTTQTNCAFLWFCFTSPPLEAMAS